MRVTTLQVIGIILGVLVSGTLLLGWVRKELVGLYHAAKRIEAALGVDVQGKTLRENVTEIQGDMTGLKGEVSELRGALNNGIRSDVREAIDHAAQAQRLAGKAAASAATAEQMATDALRATNALRAGVDAMTNAALTDHAGIWDALSELGIDRREDPRPRSSL